MKALASAPVAIDGSDVPFDRKIGPLTIWPGGRGRSATPWPSAGPARLVASATMPASAAPGLTETADTRPRAPSGPAAAREIPQVRVVRIDDLAEGDHL